MQVGLLPAGSNPGALGRESKEEEEREGGRSKMGRFDMKRVGHGEGQAVNLKVGHTVAWTSECINGSREAGSLQRKEGFSLQEAGRLEPRGC